MPCGSILYDFVGYIRELATIQKKPVAITECFFIFAPRKTKRYNKNVINNFFQTTN